jgi:hypothetical protein
VEDFSDQVREHRMVEFADEAFYKRLLENERRKAATKQGLAKVEREQADLRAKLDRANQNIAALQDKRRQAEQELERLRAGGTDPSTGDDGSQGQGSGSAASTDELRSRFSEEYGEELPQLVRVHQLGGLVDVEVYEVVVGRLTFEEVLSWPKLEVE